MQGLGERGVTYVVRLIANYRCVMNVVIMGAKHAASGVRCVRGEDVSIMSVVVAMTVVHFSSKYSVEKFGRVAGIASSFFFLYDAGIVRSRCEMCDTCLVDSGDTLTLLCAEHDSNISPRACIPPLDRFFF